MEDADCDIEGADIVADMATGKPAFILKHKFRTSNIEKGSQNICQEFEDPPT
uniref:Uncharacterized protein n=1 Tax=Romanomermis culicivorax TaxID=13658 RepID=A0A915IYA9_ROMCU